MTFHEGIGFGWSWEGVRMFGYERLWVCGFWECGGIEAEAGIEGFGKVDVDEYD